MCVETLLILHLHRVFGLFPNCQGINGVPQWDPALRDCNYFHERSRTAFGGALWIIIINKMKLLLSKHVSRVIRFPLFVHSVAHGIKWYPVDLQAVHASWWGLLCCCFACDKLNKEQFHWGDGNTSPLYFLLWPCAWKRSKKATHIGSLNEFGSSSEPWRCDLWQ